MACSALSLLLGTDVLYISPWCLSVSFAVFHWSQEECAGDWHDWLTDHFPPRGWAPGVCQAGLWDWARRCAARGDCRPGTSRSNTEVCRGSRYCNELRWNINLLGLLVVCQNACWQSLEDPFSFSQFLLQQKVERKGPCSWLLHLTAPIFSFLYSKICLHEGIWACLLLSLCSSCNISSSSDTLVFKDKWLSLAPIHLVWIAVQQVHNSVMFVLAASHKGSMEVTFINLILNRYSTQKQTSPSSKYRSQYMRNSSLSNYSSLTCAVSETASVSDCCPSAEEL